MGCGQQAHSRAGHWGPQLLWEAETPTNPLLTPGSEFKSYWLTQTGISLIRWLTASCLSKSQHFLTPTEFLLAYLTSNLEKKNTGCPTLCNCTRKRQKQQQQKNQEKSLSAGSFFATESRWFHCLSKIIPLPLWTACPLVSFTIIITLTKSL